MRVIQIAEQTSQGIELDITGKILPGWKAIASYAYTNAEVTEDNSNSLTIGNILEDVAKDFKLPYLMKIYPLGGSRFYFRYGKPPKKWLHTLFLN
ncbi:MAG: hypothetical protein V7L04_24660 [Nostoc sp.]|uniref:hypothetical protein n=1 Tax=Nostoc sp. TaxID=1180 RepID=UPI002FF962D1